MKGGKDSAISPSAVLAGDTPNGSDPRSKNRFAIRLRAGADGLIAENASDSTILPGLSIAELQSIAIPDVQCLLQVHRCSVWFTKRRTMQFLFSEKQCSAFYTYTCCRLEAEAVISCWNDIQEGTFMKRGGGKPKQMTICSAQRTNSSDPDPDYFVEAHPMPADILAHVPKHPGGLIGTHEGILQYNRELYKQGHKEAVATVKSLLLLAKQAADEEDEVITTKTMVPPTGDKRTYMSLATYCWPSNPEDLETPQGPWTCTDGKPFPGVRPVSTMCS